MCQRKSLVLLDKIAGSQWSCSTSNRRRNINYWILFLSYLQSRLLFFLACFRFSTASTPSSHYAGLYSCFWFCFRSTGQVPPNATATSQSFLTHPVELRWLTVIVISPLPLPLSQSSYQSSSHTAATSSCHLLFGVSCGENKGEIDFLPFPSVVWRNGTWTFHSNLTVTSSYPGRIQLKTDIFRNCRNELWGSNYLFFSALVHLYMGQCTFGVQSQPEIKSRKCESQRITVKLHWFIWKG